MPVDEENRWRAAQRGPGAEDAEIGRGRDVDDVVVAPVAKQVGEDSLAVAQRLADRARAVIAL